jgi:hypothetical protein
MVLANSWRTWRTTPLAPGARLVERRIVPAGVLVQKRTVQAGIRIIHCARPLGAASEV